MGISVWGETVGFAGVEVRPESFYRAVRRADYEGLPAQPLSLVDTCARAIALEMERDVCSMDLTRLPPDLQRLVRRDIFRFDHYKPAPVPSKEELFALRRTALQREEQRQQNEDDGVAEEGQIGEEDPWDEFRLLRAMLPTGMDIPEDDWEDPECGSRIYCEHGGYNNTGLGEDCGDPYCSDAGRVKHLIQAVNEYLGLDCDTSKDDSACHSGRVRRRPHISVYRPEPFDNMGRSHPDRVFLRTVPNCFMFEQVDWRGSEPGQEVAAVHGSEPSAREKLLLCDAVRLLRLAPLAKEAQLMAVYTVNVG